MRRMYAVVTEVHDESTEALGYHDLFALVERRRSYQQTMALHAVLSS